MIHAGSRGIVWKARVVGQVDRLLPGMPVKYSGKFLQERGKGLLRIRRDVLCAAARSVRCWP